MQTKYFWFTRAVSWMTSGGHVKKRRVEAAQQRHRPFGEARVFDDQPLVGDQHQPGIGGGLFGACADDRPAALPDRR